MGIVYRFCEMGIGDWRLYFENGDWDSGMGIENRKLCIGMGIGYCVFWNWGNYYFNYFSIIIFLFSFSNFYNSLF